MKIIIILLLAISAYGLGSILNTALREQALVDFKNAFVPIVSQKIQTIKLNDFSEKHKKIKLTVFDIGLHVNPIQPSQVDVKLSAPSSIILTGNSFGLSGAAHVRIRWAFIRKTVRVSMSVGSAGFSAKVSFKSVNSKPNIVITELNLSISSRNTSIHVSGGFIGAILNLVARIMKKRIVKSIVRSIQKSLPRIIEKKVNGMLNGLSTDVRITPSIYLKYIFPVAPTISNGYLHFNIGGYFHPVNDTAPVVSEPRNLPEYDDSAKKNFQFFLSDSLIQSALDTAQKLNLLHIPVKFKIEDHRVNMTCRTTKAPSLKFNETIQVTGFGSCDVIFDNSSTNQFTIVTEVQVVLAEEIKSGKLYFSGKKLELTKLEYKSEHPIEIKWFREAINKVLEFLLLVINDELGSKGISLPQLKRVDYSDVVQTIGDGFIAIEVNPSFQFKAKSKKTTILEGSIESIDLDEDYYTDIEVSDPN